MHNIPVRSVFGIITDFLATNPTPEAIIAYTLPDELQAQAHLLLDKHGEGELTPEEYTTMMDFARIDTLLLMLKAKMKRKLNLAAE
ncbi:MAG: hypothetical protein H7Y11_05900 [Armatimonadetes bacterium]|nr:hypothetical protein [Anaerolineae bacterium]